MWYGPKDLFDDEERGPLGRRQQFDPKGIFDPPRRLGWLSTYSATGSVGNVIIGAGLILLGLVFGFAVNPFFFLMLPFSVAIEVWFVRIMRRANRPPY